ncbi:MAG: hypothetical protein RL037_750 [Bacteroidota bacterium]|jgi:hypothetical protein
MENLIKQVCGVPKMAEDILQVNTINSTLNNVEANPGKWVGLSYQVASIIFLLCAVYNFIDPFINEGLEGLDGKAKTGLILASVIWLYAAFPMTQVIRNTGESLSSSSNNSILVFIFKDFILANIRMVGQLMAISALFLAVTVLIHRGADIKMDYVNSSLDYSIVEWIYSIPLTAASDFAYFFGFENLSETMLNGMKTWKISHDGHFLSMSGLVEIGYAFCSVLLVLLNMYISIAIYSGLYGLGATFLNFIKNPYWPVKSV